MGTPSHYVAGLRQKANSLESEITERRRVEVDVLTVKEELPQQSEDVHRLHELSTRFRTEIDPELVLREVLQAALTVYRTDTGTLFLNHPGRDDLDVPLRMGFNEDELIDDRYITMDMGAADMCFRTRKPVHVADTETDPLFENLREFSRGLGFRSVHGIPLITREGKIVGVLTLYFRNPHAVVDRESHLGELHARQAADAIEAARVRERTQLEIEERRISHMAKQQLAAIVESSDDAIIREDLNGIILSWNPAAERLFGYREEEIIGMPVNVLIAEENWGEEPDILARIRRGERVEHCEAVRRRKNGSRIEVSLSVSPIRDEAGVIIGASKIARDITEKKNFQTVSSESEKRFRDMADSVPVYVWMAGPDGRLIYLNKPWLEFTGRSLEEELGEGWKQGIHSDDAARQKAGYNLAIQSQTGYCMEYRMRRSDGTYRYMLDTGMARISPEGEFLGFIGCAIDITERKDTEEQLRHAQKMEAMGRLAGSIAHDFNNLLTTIIGYSEIALACSRKGKSSEEFLTEIGAAGNRAAGLTRQLLAYSRKQVLDPIAFNLNDSVNEMGRMLTRLIGENIDLKLKLDPSLAMIKADPGQIHQIILNLILNARDAMPKGGRLIVETANVLLDERDISPTLEISPGKHVLLTVRDTGIGMTPEVKTKIFEPYFTTKDIGKGTGLGLSSVYGIIKQSGGSISVESEPDRGSVFRMYFPVTTSESKSARSSQFFRVTDAAGSGQIILLVEDEESVRKFVGLTLIANGYRVLEASDGAQALELAKINPGFDLLLTDVVMPNLNGNELAAQLHATHPGLRTLFMSGYPSDDLSTHHFLDHGAKFLYKPFTQADLLRQVRELFESDVSEEGLVKNQS